LAGSRQASLQSSLQYPVSGVLKVREVLCLPWSVHGRVRVCEWLYGVQRPHHGLINYINTKAKCRHLTKLTCKGTLRQEFIRVYKFSHVGIFNPALETVALLAFSLIQLSPFSLCKSTVIIIQTVCGSKGVGRVESCWRPYSVGV
jgi:hypothetical protein